MENVNKQGKRIQTSLEITSCQVIGNICRTITDKGKELVGGMLTFEFKTVQLLQTSILHKTGTKFY